MKKTLALAFFILSILFTGSANVFAVISPPVLNDLSNQERSRTGINTLETSGILTRSAQMKADDMAAKSYFAHASPEGKDFWYWIDSAGYKYSMAGENLAIYFAESKEVVEAWKNSPTHKANILRPGFREIGSAVAEGVYQGHPAIFVVQHYGAPKAAETTTEITRQDPVIAPVLVKSEVVAPVVSVGVKLASKAKPVGVEVSSATVAAGEAVTEASTNFSEDVVEAEVENKGEKDRIYITNFWRQIFRRFENLIRR